MEEIWDQMPFCNKINHQQARQEQPNIVWVAAFVRDDLAWTVAWS